MGCSTVRRQDPVKKIIILPGGSYRSFRRRIHWGLLLMLLGCLSPPDPAHGRKQRKMRKEIAKSEVFASLFSRE
jgi:hypothetical protein